MRPIRSFVASTRTEEVGQPGTDSTAWGAGDVVAAETSAENGYMWLGVLQDNLGPLVKDDTCISIQWLETDDVDDANGPRDVKYTEGEVAEAKKRWLFDRLDKAEVR